jgi:long-subunit acyl-CoA synthetase (AMP-forming)
VRPHAINGVPRFYEKVRERVMQVIGSKPFLRLLGGYARKKGMRRAFGGRLIWAISGGAALDPQVAEFYWENGIQLFQGYGLTETSPVLTGNNPKHNKIGTVGVPFPGVEIKIADDGEILARGPNIMKGYWRKPEATAQAIDPDGWFHTGDVGEIVDNTYLRITDRKKDIFVLAGGKNIAPVALENALIRNPLHRAGGHLRRQKEVRRRADCARLRATGRVGAAAGHRVSLARGTGAESNRVRLHRAAGRRGDAPVCTL